MLRSVIAVTLVLLLKACGSSDNSTGGTAGTGGGGASAGATGGASPSAGSSAVGGSAPSGGASGSAVHGGISVNLQAPAGCALTAQYLDFPTVAGGHPVTATDDSGGIADTGAGSAAQVRCKWFSSAAPYMIDTGITIGNSAKQHIVSIGSDFPAAVGATSTGTLILQVPELADQTGYTASCTFTTIKLDAATHSLWGSFTCDSVLDSTQNATQCNVGPSYFYFDNCTVP